MSKFFKPTPYNNETKNQMWMSMIADGHDICCSCFFPFAHLLDSIFPEGHSDRNKTIEEIIDRDYKIWLSGGTEERGGGMENTEENIINQGDTKEEPLPEEDIDILLAAAAADAEKDTR